MADGRTMVTRSKLNSLETLLAKAKPEFEKVLPDYLTPERLIKTAIVAASRTPRLLECTPESFLQACMTAAELGLEPSNVLGLFYLVPFKNGKTGRYEVVGITGYKGLINLALRNPKISSIRARVVHANDEFSIEYGFEEKLVHRPTIQGDPGPIFGAYAVARLADGTHVFEYLPKPEIDKIRARAKAKADGSWVTDYGQMARKTLIRRLCNYLPLAPDLTKALEVDAHAEETIRTVSATVVEENGSRSEDLAKRLAAAARPEPETKESEEWIDPVPDPEPEPEPLPGVEQVRELAESLGLTIRDIERLERRKANRWTASGIIRIQKRLQEILAGEPPEERWKNWKTVVGDRNRDSGEPGVRDEVFSYQPVQNSGEEKTSLSPRIDDFVRALDAKGIALSAFEFARDKLIEDWTEADFEKSERELGELLAGRSQEEVFGGKEGKRS